MQMVELKWRYRGLKQNLNRARAFMGKKLFLRKAKKGKISAKDLSEKGNKG